jgi:hypothetical protein
MQDKQGEQSLVVENDHIKIKFLHTAKGSVIEPSYPVSGRFGDATKMVKQTWELPPVMTQMTPAFSLKKIVKKESQVLATIAESIVTKTLPMKK